MLNKNVNILDETSILSKFIWWDLSIFEFLATKVRLNLEYGFSQKLKDELIKLRANQPKEPSAGSAFKNPKGDYAGRLIEAVGLKGYQIGGMAWSNVHSNFLVNLGDGTFDEAIELIELAKKRVYQKFGIVLEEEVQII